MLIMLKVIGSRKHIYEFEGWQEPTIEHSLMTIEMRCERRLINPPDHQVPREFARLDYQVNLLTGKCKAYWTYASIEGAPLRRLHVQFNRCFYEQLIEYWEQV